MSVGPIQSFPPQKNELAVNPSPAPRHAETTHESDGAVDKAVQPVSGTLPKQETSSAKNVHPPFESPQDVVEVHQDPETKGQIIDYLDKAKNVILQVPSSQELSVERGIAQELQRAAQQLAKSETTSANTGEKTYGD
jgi:hypothetical protein